MAVNEGTIVKGEKIVKGRTLLPAGYHLLATTCWLPPAVVPDLSQMIMTMFISPENLFLVYLPHRKSLTEED